MIVRKKPVEVEAVQFMPGEMANCLTTDWWFDACCDGVVKFCYDTVKGCYAIVRTLEGDMRCNAGDYVIRGVNGELYPIKSDIFDVTYEIVKR